MRDKNIKGELKGVSDLKTRNGLHARQTGVKRITAFRIINQKKEATKKPKHGKESRSRSENVKNAASLRHQ